MGAQVSNLIPRNASDMSPLLVLTPKDGKLMTTLNFVPCYHHSVCIRLFFGDTLKTRHENNTTHNVIKGTHEPTT